MFRRLVVVCALACGGLSFGVAPVARAATVSAGSCTSTVGSSTNVTMSVDADSMCILQFKNPGSTTWTVPAGITEAEVFIVGGGGAGAWSDVYAQGGGGGGGIAHKTGLSVSGTWTVTVGAGGTGTNTPASWTSGVASTVTNGSVTITADGGGAGAGWGGAVGFSGGSGGGGHWFNSCCDKGVATKGSSSGVTGVVLYGNDGGNSNFANSAGGGGGGATTAGTAGTAGQVGGNGGEGLSSSITGTAVVYGSGGSGIGTNGGGTPGTNAGQGYTAAQGGDGAANTGAGGGGGAFGYRSGHGGSGIVIVKYGPMASAPANTAAPTVSGTTTNGQTLTGTQGTWTGHPAPSYTYRWKRASTVGGVYSNITGATSLTYSLTDDDIDKFLKFEVTATNASGAVAVLSSATAKIADMVRPTTTTTSTTTTLAPALQIEVVAPTTTVAVTGASTPATNTTVSVSVDRTTQRSSGTTTATRPAASATTTTTTSTVPPTTTTTTVPVPSIRAVGAGEAAAEIGGEQTDAVVERIDNQLIVSAGPMSATFGSVDGTGATGALDDDGNVRLRRGDSVRIKASGFEPGSTIDVWLFSSPVRLGSAEVASDGAVTGTFSVPDDAQEGAHRIAIVARTADGEPATLVVGIFVGEWEKSSNIATWLIVMPIVMAVAGALVLPATRRRRRSRATAV